jgi:hypothetical protein
MDDALREAAEPDSLTLLPEVDVRRALAGRILTFTLLAPPYPAIGVGALRVLRIVEREGAADVIAGYERYERPELPPEPAGAVFA